MTDILIVDDDELFRLGLERLLSRHGYGFATAEDVPTARALLANRDFDLVLCDIRLPGGSGLELLRDVSEQLPDTAFVMVTGIDDPEVARQAIEVGAYGYIVKPFEPSEVLISVMNALRRRDLQREGRQRTEELETKILDRTLALRDAITRLERQESESISAQNATVDRLGKALALRDEETGLHIERMSRYSEILALRLGFDREETEDIRLASMLHDVGKIGVPDDILLKPGKLTDDEFEMVKRHSEMGHRLLIGSQARVLALGAVIALTHHERWDGRGYPGGLSGDAIPLEGRIATVADVFDALTSRRVYREAFPVDRAIEMMRAGRASQFDPEVLDAFLDGLDEVLAVRAGLPDDEAPVSTSPIRVLVIDDHPLFQDSLVRILGRDRGIRVVGTAGSVQEGIAAARAEGPDVVVLDWQLPDGTGADAARAIRADSPGMKVVFLTGSTDPAVLREAIDVGCNGYLTKTKAADEVVSAVRAAHAGEAMMPASLVRTLVNRARSPEDGRTASLTAREAEILGMLAHGYSNKAIAENLYLSVNTVRNHVQALITKLQAHSKLEAVAKAARQGLIDLTQSSVS